MRSRARTWIAWLAPLLLAPPGVPLAAEVIVAPGASGETLEVTVANPSVIAWLHGVTVAPAQVPAFITSITPGATPTTPAEIGPGGTAVASFALDVSPAAAPGALDTLTLEVTTAGGDTTHVAVRVIVGALGPVASLPYAESFDVGAGDALGTGTWAWGAPTSGPGHAASGGSLWATNLGGDYDDDAGDLLYLRPLDLSATIAPRLSFQHWYETEYGGDGGVLQVSRDSGATFVDVAPIGGYPASVAGTPAFSGRSDPGTAFAPAVFPLAAFAGETIVARLVLASDAAITRPGWYVDDVAAAEGPAVDAAAVAIDGPGPVSADAPGLMVAGRTANLGSASIGYWVRLAADTTGDPESDPAVAWRDSFLVVSLAPGDTLPFARPLPTGVLATGVAYTLRLSVAAAGDAYADDDRATAPLTVLASVAPPYRDGFDAAQSAHAAGSPPWGRGAPTAGPGAPFTGAACWGASLAGGYPAGAVHILYAGAFDLSGSSRPFLRFFHWYDLEAGYDGARVAVSTDGASWTVVRPEPGYTAPVVALAGDSAWTDASGGWQPVEIDLSPWVGQPRVLARFELAADGSGSRPGWFVDSLSVLDRDPVGVDAERIARVEMSPPQPTPAHGPLSLAFALPLAGIVRLDVFDVRGRRVATPIAGLRQAGRHVAQWDARDRHGTPVASGVYWFRLNALGTSITRRGVVIR